jgi:hypothetical protein
LQILMVYDADLPLILRGYEPKFNSQNDRVHGIGPSEIVSLLSREHENRPSF